ncbi:MULTISPECIES: hydrogenase/urease nickel incorporation protein HypA [Helicobacter]|uniref:hydrogenase/urease nickel incorporation protein HypA n=1 Tax=Helicobacter TaxID=209 RepID=UPI0006902DB5|nr:hydrogenase/urease nickel incorporation protein HypA [Helicobacter sp. MIT 03-1616]TLD88268.1 hydrogenase/urease nickel incorporation protein HypA [Helicobacter sp. MIT 03-1616]
MHEYSIVASLIQMCESHAKEHNAASIAKVCIAVGERSGVDSALVKSAFETFRLESPLCKNANIEIEYQPVVLHCQSCERDFSGENLTYSTCPFCRSQQVIITQGRELHLLNLELDIEDIQDSIQTQESYMMSSS